jgi:predicted nucleic acid-binding protein
MTAVDTSVVVAAFASWHAGHASAVAALARRPRVPAHVLVASHYADLLKHAVAAGMTGGAVYDALIAATVKQSGGVLLTRDVRASTVYDPMKVRHELVG